MPTVHFRYSASLSFGHRTDFETRLAKVIAEQMDSMDDNGQQVTHTPSQIHFPVFDMMTGVNHDLVEMDITGYDWPNRLLDMEDRLKRITAWVRDDLDLGPYTVSAEFIPIPIGCWARS